MKEEVEIIGKKDGTFVARLMWKSVCVETPLPPGFETWSDEEQRAHLKRFIVPRFKALIERARAGLRLQSQTGEVIVQLEPDRIRLERAAAKRKRKAQKLH